MSDNMARAYDLHSAREFVRLLRELRGYLHACHKSHHGTDFLGRMHAASALESITDDQAMAAGIALANSREH